MRKLVVLSFITLDGVMQAPGGPEDDPTGGFKHGGHGLTHYLPHIVRRRNARRVN